MSNIVGLCETPAGLGIIKDVCETNTGELQSMVFVRHKHRRAAINGICETQTPAHVSLNQF